MDTAQIVSANPGFLQNTVLHGNIQSNFAVQKGQTSFYHHAGHCTNRYEVFAVPKTQTDPSLVIELVWKHGKGFRAKCTNSQGVGGQCCLAENVCGLRKAHREQG